MTPSFSEVSVEGGALRVARWDGGDGAPVVLAAHGITATHAQWHRIARALGGSVTFIAPDLRGRGGSRFGEGPFGHRVQARDLIAILDAFAVKRATLVGHSGGGWDVCYAAAEYPDRAGAVVVMDGGIRILQPPPGASVEELTRSIIGPSLDRLSMTFASRATYHDFWRAHPGLTAEGWNADIERYLDYDLVEQPDGTFRSGVSRDAVLADAEGTLFDDALCDAIFRVTQPLWFLRAARGVMNGAPIYGDAAMDTLRARVPHAEIETLDTNHFLLGLGAAAVDVADRIAKAVRA